MGDLSIGTIYLIKAIKSFSGMQGKSLMKQLKGETYEHREDVYCEAYETIAET